MKPDIFFTDKDLESYAEKISNDSKNGSWKMTYDHLLKCCDDIMEKEVVQQEGAYCMLTMGNYITTLAVASRLCRFMGHENEYWRKALSWADAACGFENWGNEFFINNDLQAAHLMRGFAILLDCCGDLLTDAEKEKITARLLKQSRIMYEFGKDTGGLRLWQESWLQNHLWNCVGGLTCAALALREEYPETKSWLDLSVDKIVNKSLPVFPEDGASHEGLAYWIYGFEQIALAMYLFERHLGTDSFKTSKWFANTADYCIYILLPPAYWEKQTGCLNFGDTDGEFYSADYNLKLLAARFNLPEAQYTADMQISKGYGRTGMPWLGLLWQGDVEGRSCAEMNKPFTKHFEDLGLISARSGWEDDADILGFHCGPPLGHGYKLKRDTGAGHVHPDVNHITLFSGGENLLSDDLYPKFKRTCNHSTLTVGEKGQFGDGDMWYQAERQLQFENQAKITYFEDKDGRVLIEGDGLGAYPPEAGLSRFVRRIEYFPAKKRMLVTDDIAQTGCEELILRFWTEQPDELSADGNSAFIRIGSKRMRIESKSGETLYHERMLADTRFEKDGYERNAICLKSNAKNWNSVTEISWT